MKTPGAIRRRKAGHTQDVKVRYTVAEREEIGVRAAALGWSVSRFVAEASLRELPVIDVRQFSRDLMAVRRDLSLLAAEFETAMALGHDLPIAMVGRMDVLVGVIEGMLPRDRAPRLDVEATP